MKVIFFDEEKNIINTIENLKDVKIYGLDEIKWNNGAMSGIEDSYVILENDQNFEDLTEVEILEQFKLQTKYSLAKNYEENKIEYLVNDTNEEKLQQLQTDKNEVDTRNDKEQVTIKLHERGLRVPRRERRRELTPENSAPPPFEGIDPEK